MIGRKTGLAIFLILVLAGSLFAVHAARSTDAAVPYAGAVAVGMFGYAGVLQHPLESASGPLCGAWSNVIAIRPPERAES